MVLSVVMKAEGAVKQARDGDPFKAGAIKVGL
jgi:hypothetical protein